MSRSHELVIRTQIIPEFFRVYPSQNFPSEPFLPLEEIKCFFFCCCLFVFSQGIHLGKPDNCPDFVYAIMKECWLKDPEKRIKFREVVKRLQDPYHDYDIPPSTDDEESPGKPRGGNY